MTSELLTYATLEERERVYHGLRWLREWRRGARTSQFEAVPVPSAAARPAEQPNRCPSSETGMVAGR